ncbi:MAG: hypothetical protein WCF23_04685 [Candidatus Nitrosopolaris sp.]
MGNNSHYDGGLIRILSADIVAAPIAVSADTKNIFFATYCQPTSYVIEMRLMVPDKQILYLE